MPEDNRKGNTGMETENRSVYEINRTGGSGKGTGRVKPEDISLLQEKMFEMLVYFDEFCEKHGLKYSLAEGTCLGAVREHDFIPWDDDLDVGMLRKDFDKLFELWDQYADKERFSLYRTTKDFCAYVPIGLMRNNSTTYIREFEEGAEDRNLSVKIDIAPLDEIPDDPLLRKKQIRYAHFYALFMMGRKPRNKRKQWYLNVGATILMDVFRWKWARNIVLKIVEPQVKKFNGTGCSQLAINGLGIGRGGLWKMSDITELIKMPFHGKEFYVPADYDDFLTRGYGDYMQRPPVAKRQPYDTPVYYDLNTPFAEYLKTKREAKQ